MLIFIITVVAVVLISSLVSQLPSTAKLLVLGDTFSSYSTIRDSEFQEALKDAQIELSYENVSDGVEATSRLNEGNADLLVMSLDQFLRQKPNGKIVGLIDRSVGADAAVLNTKRYPNLRSLDDLRQMVNQTPSQGQLLKVTFAKGTSSEFLALLLEENSKHFKLSDFQIAEVPNARDTWKSLQSDSNVVLAFLWEPYVTLAQNQGYTVAFSSNDLPPMFIRAIVASNRLLNRQPEIVAKFLEIYYDRIHRTALDASLIQKQIFNNSEISPDAAEEIRKRIHFFTALESKAWFTGDNPPLEDRLRYIGNILFLKQQIERRPQNIKNIFTDQPIKTSVAATDIEDACKTSQGLDTFDKPICDFTPFREISITPFTPSPSPPPIVTPEDSISDVRPTIIYFGNLSSQLTVKNKEILYNLAKTIRELDPNQAMAVLIIGHTSNSGSDEINKKISIQRAEAVRDYLRSIGIKHRRIIPYGEGSSAPTDGIGPDDPRQRRAEIRLFPF